MKRTAFSMRVEIVCFLRGQLVPVNTVQIDGRNGSTKQQKILHADIRQTVKNSFYNRKIKKHKPEVLISPHSFLTSLTICGERRSFRCCATRQVKMILEVM